MDISNTIKSLFDKRRKQRENRRTSLENTERFDRILHTIPYVAYEYIRWPDGENQFIFVSPQIIDICECDADYIMANPSILWTMIHEDDFERVKEEDQHANETGEQFESEFRIVIPSGRQKWIQVTSMPSGQTYRSMVIWSGVIHDHYLAQKDRRRKQPLNDRTEAGPGRHQNTGGNSPGLQFL